MFGSTILDVAIGLIFLFLAVSLAASAITEAIASAMKLRQTTLRQGIGALLNDPGYEGLALSLYNHALVNPLATGAATKISELTSNPAYIQPRSFAVALVGTLREQLKQKIAARQLPPGQAPQGQAPQGQADQPPRDPTLAEIIADVADPQIRKVLTTLYIEAGEKREDFLAAVGRWFDESMDRLSGWYKRYTQVIGAAVALAICVILNADALRIGTSLWRTPTLIAELKTTAMPAADQAIQTLDGLGLLGWAAGNYPDPSTHPGDVALMVLGWLIVAGASLFGAPFWFDTLQRFVSLAGTGRSARTGPDPDAGSG